MRMCLKRSSENALRIKLLFMWLRKIRTIRVGVARMVSVVISVGLAVNGALVGFTWAAEVATEVAAQETNETSTDQISTSEAVADTDEYATTDETITNKLFANRLGMKFRLIPAGSFMMGSPISDVDRRDNEWQHQVTLSNAYYMGVCEITQGEWKQVMGQNTKSEMDTKRKSPSSEDRYPICRVSWDDAQAFVETLNTEYREELTKELGDGWMYSLPSEAEWEYACRAGTTGPYGGTGEVSDMGWHWGNNAGMEHVGGEKRPNAWGLYDMHGNVCEWCLDSCEEHAWTNTYRDNIVDPLCTYGSMRVIRSGCWDDYDSECRSASRHAKLPSQSNEFMGLRLAIRLVPLIGLSQPVSHDDAVYPAANPARDFEYKEIDGEITITRLKDRVGPVVVPMQIEGRPVTTIGGSTGKKTFTYLAFSHSMASRVILPNSVTTIGEDAFKVNTQLTTIVLPKYLTTIEKGAFYHCTKLRSITIPSSVTSIGAAAFQDCKLLRSITIPRNVTNIGNGAFIGCEQLSAIEVDPENTHYQSIDGVLFSKDGQTLVYYPEGKPGDTYTILNNVTTIERSAFQDCKLSSSITIPKNVTNIGNGAFSCCEQLSAIEVDPENTHYQSIDGVLFSKDGQTLFCYPEGKPGDTYTIPNNVTTIEDFAFNTGKNLSSITIPNSVTTIKDRSLSERQSMVFYPPKIVFYTPLGSMAWKYCQDRKLKCVPMEPTLVSGVLYSCLI